MAKSFSPLNTEEYLVDPSPRRTVAKRIWKNSPTCSSSQIESDYETMLPQLGKLNLTTTPIKQISKHSSHKRAHHKTTQLTISSTPCSYSSSSDEEAHPSNQQSKYVVFKDKSTLFMPNLDRRRSDPTYARIDENWFNNVDRSTDSGISDIYDSVSNYATSPVKSLKSKRKCLTSDDVSLISRYDRVLQRRTKKSRFRRLSEFLCSGGSHSDEEKEESGDSLYDSLESSAPSSSYGIDSTTSYSFPSSTSRSYDDGDETFHHRDEMGETLPPIAESPISSSSDEKQLRFSKKDFFYNPNKNLTCHSEYVLPDKTQLQTPTHGKGGKLCTTPGSSLKPQRKPPLASTPVTHVYENVRDFTRKRSKS